MDVPWPRLSGWLGVAFLAGIAIHSFFPYSLTPWRWMCVLWLIGSVACAAPLRSRTLRIFGVTLLVLILGIWRFDVGYSSMPRGPSPLSPKGLAFVGGTIRPSKPGDLWDRSIRLHRLLLARARERLTTDEAALLTGILYGERGLSSEKNRQFREAGLLHVIAVSGSNVTIVTVIIGAVLLSCGFHRRHALVGLGIVLTAFVVFVSPSASVVRAAFMGMCVALAPIVGRVVRPSRLLLASAVVFTAWHPWALFFDASFALSFLAMWGLLTWGVRIDRVIYPYIRSKLLREIVASSIAASLMTIPYTAWAFRQVTIWSLFTGCAVLPLVPWVMGIGSVLLIAPSTALIVWPLRGFLEVMFFVASLPERVGWGYWSVTSFSWEWMVGSYVLISVLWNVKKYPHVDRSLAKNELIVSESCHAEEER